MATVAEIAKEMGVDLSAVDPKFVSRLDTEWSTSESRMTQAQQASQLAEQNLRRAEEERQAINEYVEKYGASEETNRRLVATNAAMAAALKELNVEIPNLPAAATPPPQNTPNFDPQTVLNPVQAGFQEIGNAMFASNKYFQIFGKPMPDDIRVVAREARDAKKPVEQYIADKYGFAAEEQKQAQAREAEQQAKWKAEGVREFQEKNPNLRDNPMLGGGAESRNTVVVKPREATDLSKFAGLPTMSKIANSVARVRESIQQSRS